MKFHIPSNYDTYFSDVIKERGNTLFHDNKIKCIKINHENKVEAYIEGTKIYHVEVENKKGRLHMKCDCPCTCNCKHEYALLLYLIAFNQANIQTTTYKTFTKTIHKPTNKNMKKLSSEDKWVIFFKALETIVTVVFYFFLFLVAIIFSIGMDDYIPCGSRRGKKYKARRTYYKGGKKCYRYYY